MKAGLRATIESLLDSWACVARNDPSKDGLAYQKFEEDQASTRPLLHMPLDAELAGADQHERRFVANRSMRDVEGSVDVYVMKLKESAVALADERAEEGAMSRELWKVGVQWKDRRPEGTIHHSQIVSGYGPGALVDFVDDAAMIAGLSWWARGGEVVEDRLVAMLNRQVGYEHVKLFAPPQGEARALDDPTRKWIKAFRFPEWFVCQNERCWGRRGATSAT